MYFDLHEETKQPEDKKSAESIKKAPPPERKPDQKQSQDFGNRSPKEKKTTLLKPLKPGTYRCCSGFQNPWTGPEPFRCCCNKSGTCFQESVAVKLMYFAFMAFVSAFACIFIISYPETESKGLAGLYFCRDENNNLIKFDSYFGDCTGHAGYFMVYRIFISAAMLFLIIGLVVIHVHSSQDKCRPGVHQGYWCWKLLLYCILLGVFCLFVTLSNNAIFDEVLFFIGLVATFLFAFPTFIFILDVCELVVICFRKCSDDPDKYWKHPVYIVLVFTTYFVGFAMLSLIGQFYVKRLSAIEDTEPADIFAEGATCGFSIGLMIYAVAVAVFVTFVAIVRLVGEHNIYPNTGILQAAVVFNHSVFAIFLALGNHPDVTCRPIYYPFRPSGDVADVAFAPEGFTHAVFVWLTLAYFTLFRGPRTDSAPLSHVYKTAFAIIEPGIETPTTPKPPGAPLSDQASKDVEAGSATQSTSTAGGTPKPGISFHDGNKPASQPHGILKHTGPAPPGNPANSVPGNPTAGTASTGPTSPPGQQKPPLNQSHREPSEHSSSTYSSSEDEFLDEGKRVKYNWSLFHLFLIFGSLSLMMGITNFFRPRAEGPNFSNSAAFWTKLAISPLGVLIFTIPIFLPVKLFIVRKKGQVQTVVLEKVAQVSHGKLGARSDTDSTTSTSFAPLAPGSGKGPGKQRRKRRRPRSGSTISNPHAVPHPHHQSVASAGGSAYPESGNAGRMPSRNVPGAGGKRPSNSPNKRRATGTGVASGGVQANRASVGANRASVGAGRPAAGSGGALLNRSSVHSVGSMKKVAPASGSPPTSKKPTV